MPDEGSFLQAILTNPADDLPRLVYADWLEEQQTDEANRKAEFLRVTAALVLEASTPLRLTMERRVMELARHLPTNWLPAVSRLTVENCAAASDAIRMPLEQVEFEFECPVLWQSMSPTGDSSVRHCGECKQHVYYCSTIGEAREHAEKGHCIAVDLALPRVNGDLLAPRSTRGSKGKVSQASLERMREARRVTEVADRISAEREQAERKS